MPVANRSATGRPDRVLSGGAQPLGHERDAHDHVADDHDREILALERRRDSGRHDQHPGDLHERQQPVLDVVRVVGRGEPGEVHPRPPDREEHDQVVHDAVADPARGQVVVERSRRLRHGDHEAQVEEQLQRRRGTVGLGRVAPGHGGVPRSDQDGRARGDRAGHQWRKCRVPVMSMVAPAASATATTSSSRTEPPGWANAVTPAARQTSTASANG